MFSKNRCIQPDLVMGAARVARVDGSLLQKVEERRVVGDLNPLAFEFVHEGVTLRRLFPACPLMATANQLKELLETDVPVHQADPLLPLQKTFYNAKTVVLSWVAGRLGPCGLLFFVVLPRRLFLVGEEPDE